MATFGGLILTNNGRNLFAKAQTGKLLKFKKIILGDGELGSSESIVDMKNLKNKILECNITGLQVVQNEIATITFKLSNQNIETGFYWRELGIIAEDPDTKEEVLYIYGNARETGEYISSKGSADVLEKYISIDLVVTNVESIVAVIDNSLIYLTKKEFEQSMIKSRKLAISIEAWQQNEETLNYEYIITDENITSTHLVEGYMDLINQAKMVDGYIESFDGGFKIITSVQPLEEVTMNISMQKTIIEEA